MSRLTYKFRPLSGGGGEYVNMSRLTYKFRPLSEGGGGVEST